MIIGILQCGHMPANIAAVHGDYTEMYQQLLAGNGFEFVTFNVVDMEFPSDVHQADGWLLSGSRHGAYDDLPFIPVLENFVRRCFAGNVPVVGICFGHQIIAQALGGKVEKAKTGWSVGRTDYEFSGLGVLPLNAWHRDQVVTPPDGAQTIATSDTCQYAAFLYGDNAYTVQPHPEFSNTFIGNFVPVRRGTLDYPDELMDRAVANSNYPVANTAIAEQIAAFFKQDRKR